MSHMGKSHLVIMFTVGSDDVAEGDRLFASHGEWMKGHPREGDVALLDYSISKGPELSNPLDPNSEPTGKTIFVLDEYYESLAGIARHWQDGMDNWLNLPAVMAWGAKGTAATLRCELRFLSSQKERTQKERRSSARKSASSWSTLLSLILSDAFSGLKTTFGSGLASEPVVDSGETSLRNTFL